jgi:hypothetical protein
MLGRLAILMAAAVSLGVAATPTGAMAAHGAGGGGHFGGGAAGGGRSFSGGFRFSGHGLPGGYALVNPGVSGRLSAGRGVPGTAPLVGRHVSSDHRFAWIGHLAICCVDSSIELRVVSMDIQPVSAARRFLTVANEPPAR